MTCAHVLGLIDAGPFADYPRAHLDAAWEHARQCSTCGPALEAANALPADLAALPRPAPPLDLAAAVLARIALIEQVQGASVAGPMPDTSVFSSARNWSVWATALGSVAAGLTIVLSRETTLIEMASPRIGGLTTGLVPMPSMTTEGLVLAAGLVLYAVGLLAPVGGRNRRSRITS